MEEQNTRVEVKRRFNVKKIVSLLIILVTFASLPNSVKCDTGDTFASMILFILITVFICAGIGWWKKRGEEK